MVIGDQRDTSVIVANQVAVVVVGVFVGACGVAVVEINIVGLGGGFKVIVHSCKLISNVGVAQVVNTAVLPVAAYLLAVDILGELLDVAVGIIVRLFYNYSL